MRLDFELKQKRQVSPPSEVNEYGLVLHTYEWGVNFGVVAALLLTTVLPGIAYHLLVYSPGASFIEQFVESIPKVFTTAAVEVTNKASSKLNRVIMEVEDLKALLHTICSLK